MSDIDLDDLRKSVKPGKKAAGKLSAGRRFWNWLDQIDWLFPTIITVVIIFIVMFFYGLYVAGSASNEKTKINTQAHTMGEACRREDMSMMQCIEKYPTLPPVKIKVGWSEANDDISTAKCSPAKHDVDFDKLVNEVSKQADRGMKSLLREVEKFRNANK